VTTAVEVRVARPGEIDLVNGFYASEGRTTRVNEGEQWVIALEGSAMVGVLRICIEEGHQVLRTVQVTEARRGQGIGRRMLDLVPPMLRNGACFCLPYAHLTEFYGRIGFTRIPAEAAPRHLQDRLAGYLADGRDMIAMRRD
jgi:N-acetylglutamate synthase-like GNAT family acetyltransferase